MPQGGGSWKLTKAKSFTLPDLYFWHTGNLDELNRLLLNLLKLSPNHLWGWNCYHKHLHGPLDVDIFWGRWNICTISQLSCTVSLHIRDVIVLQHKVKLTLANTSFPWTLPSVHVFHLKDTNNWSQSRKDNPDFVSTCHCCHFKQVTNTQGSTPMLTRRHLWYTASSVRLKCRVGWRCFSCVNRNMRDIYRARGLLLSLCSHLPWNVDILPSWRRDAYILHSASLLQLWQE